MKDGKGFKLGKKEIDGKYFYAGATAFLVVAALMLFFFFIFKIDVIGGFAANLIKILRPILVGFVIAYLLMPIAKFLEKYTGHFFVEKCKLKKVGNKLARGISIALSIIFFIIVIGALIWLIAPQIVDSIVSLAKDLPQQIESVVAWLTGLFSENAYLESMASSLLEIGNDWVEQDMLGTVTSWAGQIATGVVKTAYFLWDFFIGLIVTIYILASRERFAAQFKKVLFAMLQAKTAKKIIYVIRKSNSVFSGFINGKLLDSAIIGVMCFIGVSLLGMPYTVLVSVIVGVTNVIPVFGPYIGAVPCTIIIFLTDPMKGLYFLLFIIALQAFDGNVLGPKILGDSTGLSPFWVVFTIVLGGGLFGVTGMIIGVPTFAVIYYLFSEWVTKRLKAKDLPVSTDAYINVTDGEGNPSEEKGTD